MGPYWKSRIKRPHLLETIISFYTSVFRSGHYKLDQNLLREKEGELITKADDYYNDLTSNEYLRNKPFSTPFETPELLQNFGLLLSGLNIPRGAVVLDFGAGPAYTSEFLMRMGCKVIATDVSQRVLQYAEEKVTLDPRNGENGSFQWELLSNNELRGIPHESVDRIVVVDCFHHVADIQATLKCFARILRPGGIVGFSEPGYNHSQSPNAQKEMTLYGTLENDVILEDIWLKAKAVGFDRLWIKPILPQSTAIDISRYKAAKVGFFLNFTTFRLAKHFQSHLIFFLKKAGTEQLDSRGIDGLSAKIELSLQSPLESVRPSQEIEFRCKLTNTGAATWLHKSWRDVGTVRIGVHWLNGTSGVEDYDYQRFGIPNDLPPGGQVCIEGTLTLPPKGGKQILVWDLVSEAVCWFGRINACNPTVVQVNTTVAGAIGGNT